MQNEKNESEARNLMWNKEIIICENIKQRNFNLYFHGFKIWDECGKNTLTNIE